MLGPILNIDNEEINIPNKNIINNPQVCPNHCNNNSKKFNDLIIRDEVIEKNKNMCIECFKDVIYWKDRVQSFNQGLCFHKTCFEN